MPQTPLTRKSKVRIENSLIPVYETPVGFIPQ